MATARRVLAGVDLVRLEDPLLDVAGTLGNASLRSLDAVHLATARALGSALETIITYDERFAAAAREIGMRTERPT